ncbi:hypothetical protein DM02DRAFT_625290 [Periconia macrospinosa]|uniref:Transcription factor domain-containing protein n=1 Tax=Periconia macrospinosa TaxID=97972 RepID=A0A2V1E0Z7_9PLEO|nr:hypothetical protein DM02DRAFT_625290 [Periconia macrospinosa]
MSLEKNNQFQFITVSNPMKSGAAGSRKANHSHIMRQIHARKRRLQMQRYVDESMDNGANQDLSIFEWFLAVPLRQVSSRTDPFSSMARPLSLVEEFLLDHYIQVVLPFTIGHCDVFDKPGDHKKEVFQDWVGLAISDSALMAAGVLLSTCRYILYHRPEHPVFSRMVLQYKRICLQALRGQIVGNESPVKPATVATALALAVDETNAGEDGAARKHLQGVMAMIHFSGGIESIGVRGLVERMFRRFITLHELENPALTPFCGKFGAAKVLAPSNITS